jgi:NodT family efflux transporter outer membrane factor (OMF) lipoprotein
MRKTIPFALLLALAGCRVGPNYSRPTAPIPPAFKESPPANFKEAAADGFKPSQPNDAFAKGKWWEIYNDPALSALEEQVAIDNQNVLSAQAQYNQAKAAVSVARAALYPTVTTSPGITESKAAAAGANTNSPITAHRAVFTIPFSVSWEPDLWGNLRRAVTGDVDTAQSLAALVENAKLLYQSELAQDYFGLHGLDGEAELLTRTASSYQEYLTLTRNRYAAGVASDLDVAQAESQLYGVQAQEIDLGVQRAAFEHAIAILTGKPPSALTIPVKTLAALPPPVPVGMPSELLERRPDIASSERKVAAANEQIGIAMAAFYPTVTLSASAGFTGSTLLKWFNWPSRFWSVGPQLAQTLFDAGRRRGVVVEQEAAYDQTVADYRQTVLTALQQVEDNLAALRVLENESTTLQDTINSADRALTISNAQYRAGTTSFLTVIISQATLLDAQRSQIALLTRRLAASVLLVEAVGGGWDVSKLPTDTELRKKS